MSGASHFESAGLRVSVGGRTEIARTRTGSDGRAVQGDDAEDPGPAWDSAAAFEG